MLSVSAPNNIGGQKCLSAMCLFVGQIIVIVWVMIAVW